MMKEKNTLDCLHPTMAMMAEAAASRVAMMEMTFIVGV
jgi:hypothetical protein